MSIYTHRELNDAADPSMPLDPASGPTDDLESKTTSVPGHQPLGLRDYTEDLECLDIYC